jgi:protocatechuate 3,4-dioxygenase alpha subunit
MKQTPSQTIGPFFAHSLTAMESGYPHSQVADANLVGADTQGERIRLTGRVFDGSGEAVDDALIEIWQANANGRFNHPNDQRVGRPLDLTFKGFGRSGTGRRGDRRFCFETIKPGAAQAGHAPFISIIVFMRGLLAHAYTRVYFGDEREANTADPVLGHIDPERQPTLIATRQETGTGVEYIFDIHMQGDRETVFFDI